MPSCNYWVFREGRSKVEGRSLRSGLVQALQKVQADDPDSLDDALLRAGELETALSDAGCEDAAPAALITNALAAALVGLWNSAVRLDSLAIAAELLRVPETLNVSTPEGFAYYALHPLSFSQLANDLDISGSHAAVIGIRSIGATLSAVVTATLARRRIAAQRITVRPGGHPYDRRTLFSPVQRRWIAAQRAHEADFFVVDEGPGLSGSSFLSVAEALLEAGVERRRIRFLCSHEADPDSLAAQNAGVRWRGFQTRWVSGRIPRLPHDAQEYCSGGEWRKWMYANETDWPAAWTQMERAKFLSADRRLFKFAGYGRFGSAVAERARLLADSGFGPKLLGVAGGFAEFLVVDGRPATPSDLSRAVIHRIADYCALRAAEFRAQGQNSRLAEIIQFNLGELAGDAAPKFTLPEDPDRAVLCDSRMQPHEWMISREGVRVKTDGDSHGDDHFFPGPCDIAWDLAGAAIEWRMNADAVEELLRTFGKRSGDNVRPRFSSYAIAYAVMRAAYCSMAAFALRGTAEETRLLVAARFYQSLIAKPRSTRQPVESALSSLVPIFDTL